MTTLQGIKKINISQSDLPDSVLFYANAERESIIQKYWNLKGDINDAYNRVRSGKFIEFNRGKIWQSFLKRNKLKSTLV